MITIICGPPGAGKTSLLAYFCTYHMAWTAFEDCQNTNTLIELFNNAGYRFSYIYDHCCASNFACVVSERFCIDHVSYDMDGTDFGLYDPEHKTKFVPPGFRLFFHESQVILNSRKSSNFRDSVSRAFELHRHWGLNIYLDCQRETLIDLNVRELAGQIIECQEFETKLDNVGQIIQCIWHTRVFDCNSTYEQYLASGKKNKDYVKQKFVFEGNIFNSYQSECGFPLFLDGRKYQNFDLKHHVLPSYSKEYIDGYITRHSLSSLNSTGYLNRSK